MAILRIILTHKLNIEKISLAASKERIKLMKTIDLIEIHFSCEKRNAAKLPKGFGRFLFSKRKKG